MSSRSLTYDDIVKLMKEIEPPWQKYRGKVQLCVSDWLSNSQPIMRIADIVIIQREAYQLTRTWDWGPFGPPSDNEFAALIAYAIDQKETKPTNTLFGLTRFNLTHLT